MLSRAEKRAVELLTENQAKLRRLVDLLLANETINGSDVYAIAGVPEPSGVDAGWTLAPQRAAATGTTSGNAASGQAVAADGG